MLIAPLFCFMGEPLENNNHSEFVQMDRPVGAFFNFPCISILETPNIHTRKLVHLPTCVKIVAYTYIQGFKGEDGVIHIVLISQMSYLLWGLLFLFLPSSSGYFLSVGYISCTSRDQDDLGLLCFALTLASQGCDIYSSA